MADAHALALRRSGPPTTYVISSATPFLPADVSDLQDNAPDVIERRCPGLVERMLARGWRPPHTIGRVYDSSRAERELGYSPRFGIDACLSGDWDPFPSR